MRLACAQLRYTWAERRLDGRGPGFGVVLRSRDWPAGLLEDPELRDLLTNLPSADRREPADGGAPLLACRRVAGGSLLVAKRAVGTDGSGRPGNYSAHALFDPTGTLGALDLVALAAGTFRLFREVDVVPDDDAPAVLIEVADRWLPPSASGGLPPSASGVSGASVGGSAGPAAASMGAPASPSPAPVPVPGSSGSVPEPDGALGEPPVRAARADALAATLGVLATRLPADLVNGLDVLPAAGASPGPGRLDGWAERCAAAVELGAVGREAWWLRRGWDAEAWFADLDAFVVLHQPVREVPDRWLWTRWDQASTGARTQLARELLQRPHLADDATAVAALRERPALLAAAVTAAVKGSAKGRRAAGALVAAAGSDDDAFGTAEQVLRIDGTLPPALAERLQQYAPDALPDRLAEAVAERLDGAAPMAEPWRRHCLELFVDGLPTCAHVDALAAAASDHELSRAVAGVPDPATAADAWERLYPVLPFGRLTAVFAAAGRLPAEFLLVQPLDGQSRVSMQTLGDVWPTLTRSAGWADWPRLLVTRLRAAERQLRRQRLVLLVLCGVLALAVLVLGLLVGLDGGTGPADLPSAPPSSSLPSPAAS